MSSYHDSFGAGPESYDDDPEGERAREVEEWDERDEHPERYEQSKCKHENTIGNGGGFYCLDCRNGYWIVIKNEMTIAEARRRFPARSLTMKAMWRTEL